MLIKILHSPYLNLFSGLILLLTALYDIVQDSSLGAHHGLFIFALIHILQVMPGLFGSIKNIDQARNDIHHH